jgi:hypothetical protein
MLNLAVRTVTTGLYTVKANIFVRTATKLDKLVSTGFLVKKQSYFLADQGTERIIQSVRQSITYEVIYAVPCSVKLSAVSPLANRSGRICSHASVISECDAVPGLILLSLTKKRSDFTFRI